jgi:hypothetical protein
LREAGGQHNCSSSSLEGLLVIVEEQCCQR